MSNTFTGTSVYLDDHSKDPYTVMTKPTFIDAIIINPDTNYRFADGFSITGKELIILVKTLLRDAKERYPEEFL